MSSKGSEVAVSEVVEEDFLFKADGWLNNDLCAILVPMDEWGVGLGSLKDTFMISSSFWMN